ncbi:2,3-bisphosphoglycerate-independent phosphoglycerate mutase [Spongiactinospora gelatinilytica]|nr:2,3-bisphosphoglycerate-independent phosphoglycerate mutase [Spongiactinospora gelatinilytica]
MPGVLLVLDGWGHAPPAPGNAISEAECPFLEGLVLGRRGVLLDASGGAVGLPEGTVGNSEIGHMVMGAGRPIEYDSLRVEQQVKSGALRSHPLLREACVRLAQQRGTLHLVGLISDGRIHSDIDHIAEVLRAARAHALERVVIHAITDGRDVPDGTGALYLSRLNEIVKVSGVGAVATVIGRNFAMDKSGADHLTAQAALLVLDGRAERSAPNAEDALRGGAPDGSVTATVITGATGGPAPVRDGDAIVFMNFRSDRMAPLADMVAVLLASTARSRVRLLSLGHYDTHAGIPALVPRADASGGLADALENSEVRSVRIAEREKFEHVTFYLNGRDARPRQQEEHVLVPPAATGPVQDHPEMNLRGLVQAVIEAAARPDVGLVVANLANMDVVGHTGAYHATRKAVEAVDRAAAQICSTAFAGGRWTLLVGDHGNAEQMLTSPTDGAPAIGYGGHTTNRVPCALISVRGERLKIPSGGEAAICSVGPTVLRLLGLPIPAAMSAPELVDDSAQPIRQG